MREKVDRVFQELAVVGLISFLLAVAEMTGARGSRRVLRSVDGVVGFVEDVVDRMSTEDFDKEVFEFVHIALFVVRGRALIA